MPTTILDNETYLEALQRRYAEEVKAEERMNNDRELLELAAKAAGYEGFAYKIIPAHGGGDAFVKTSDRVCFSGETWNPLTDDGDALRLAVKLGFTVRVDNRAGFSWVKGFEGSTPHTDDPYAATRRAIVRAAAEIGMAMSTIRARGEK